MFYCKRTVIRDEEHKTQPLVLEPGECFEHGLSLIRFSHRPSESVTTGTSLLPFLSLYVRTFLTWFLPLFIPSPLATHLAWVLGVRGRTSGWVRSGDPHCGSSHWPPTPHPQPVLFCFLVPRTLQRAHRIAQVSKQSSPKCKSKSLNVEEAEFLFIVWRTSFFYIQRLWLPLRCQCQKWQSWQHDSVL